MIPSSLLHPARRLERIAAAWLGAVLLTGCQSFSTATSFARVRVIDLSAESTSADVYLGGNAVAYNLNYGTVTSYVPMAPGSYTMTVDLSGSRQVLSSLKGTFVAGGQYTVLLNTPASLPQMILTDRVPLAPSAPFVRLIHQASYTGAVDVYLVPAGQRLTSVNAIVTNLMPGASTGYLAVPVGVGMVVMLPAGTLPSASTLAVHTGTQMDYENGSAHSLILLDPAPPTTAGLQVMTTTDAEPIS